MKMIAPPPAPTDPLDREPEGATAEFRVVPSPQSPQTPARHWRWWLVVFGLWTLYAIASAKQTALMIALSEGREQAQPATAFVPWALSTMWFWAALTPGIVWLARRYHLDRRHWAARLALHVAVALALAYVDAAWDMWVRPYVLPYPRRPVLVAFLSQVDTNVFQYFVIVAIVHSLGYYRLYRERKVMAAELGAQLATAQLEVLKMQLQPHFLFNTLHSIAELVHEDADAADRMVTQLGDFLRLSLDHAGRPEVPLRQELEFLNAYLGIQRIRFGERLRVRTNVEVDALDALVPNLVLQPLVENAIRHGIAAHARSGVIEVLARRRGDRLELEVGDNGGGLLGPADTLAEGVGLSNTRSRLERLYGTSHYSMMLRNRTMGGVIVTLTIPHRTASGAPLGVDVAHAALAQSAASTAGRVAS
jgi:two-component system, LytTR family, sensor kinase